MAKDEPKTCFVIAPIGEEGSETRERSDQILNHIIKPTAEECGYLALRADEIPEPGMITAQVIQHVVDDPMVIADLTDWNANVFYELALRHAISKPAVHIIEAGQKIPFDVAGTRTINVNYHNLDSVHACKLELAKQIRAVEKDPSLVDNPISVSVELQSLRQSGNPLEKSAAEIMSMLQEIRFTVSQQRTPSRPFPLGLVKDAAESTDQLESLLQDLSAMTAGEPEAHLVSEALAIVEQPLKRASRYLRRRRSAKETRTTEDMTDEEVQEE